MNHQSGKHRARRAESFGVRRWLQFGAASAGVSAALFAASLAGPGTGVALADDSGSSAESSQTASSSQTTSSQTATSSTNDSDTGATAGSDSSSKSDSDPKTSVGSGRTKDNSDANSDPADDTTGTESEAEAEESDAIEPSGSDDPPKSTALNSTAPNSKASKTAASKTEADSLVAEAEPAVVETVAEQPEPAPPTETEQTETEQTQAAAEPTSPWAIQVSSTEDPRKQFIRRSITTWTSSSMGWIGSLPVPTELKTHMEGAVWTVRRSFLNLAPTVAPIQVSGQATGPIMGRVDAVDPEGDRIVYRVVKGPTLGNVVVNADGTFVYTPGDEFDGVDSFVIVAQDRGLHVNLLDPFRGGTSAGTLVNQGAIKFEFNYTTGAEYWTPERKDALNASATAVAAYLMVHAPVVITYDVTGLNDSESSTLAAAGSQLISTSPGFHATVVQNKILTGVDANGDEADGEIDWNFGDEWGLGDSVDSDEYDFKATAMHELMHSFGFSSQVRLENTRKHWPVLSSFIVTADGVRPIGADFNWDTDYDPYVTGANGGLYFGGANAVAAYGGLVPLFTPNPYQSGSTMSHLDDATFTGADQKMMNSHTGTGLGIRVLSPLELGILADIGYIVVVPQQPNASTANMVV